MRALQFLLVFLCVFGEIIDLTADTFDSVVNGEKNAFVEFYAPWCTHCQKFAPEYAAVESAFNQTDSIVFARVQADEETELSHRFDIQSFPTLLYFAKGSSDPPEKYKDSREKETVVQWLNERLGTDVRIPKPESFVVTLTPGTFDEIVFQKDKYVLVKFFAPWCGHCKQLAPVYEQVARIFMEEPKIIIAEMDADMYASFSHQFHVAGFPTIKLFYNGQIFDYSGGRDLVSLVGFMNGAADTYRRVDGNLDLHYGRIPEIDARLGRIREKSHEQIQELLKFIDELKAEEAKKKVYKSILLKMESEGREYVAREIEKMERYVKNSQIAPTKRTFFKIRNNILHAFAEVLDEQRESRDADGISNGMKDGASNGMKSQDTNNMNTQYSNELFSLSKQTQRPSI